MQHAAPQVDNCTQHNGAGVHVQQIVWAAPFLEWRRLAVSETVSLTRLKANLPICHAQLYP